jgi:glucosamine-6-phosphate deaminase
MKTFYKDKLKVYIDDTDVAMGERAGADIAAAIKELLKEKEEINMIFGAAPSQNTTLAALLTHDIPWERINAFHMDEYIGLPVGSPAAFREYLKEHIFGKAPFKSINYIDAFSEDKEAECARYTKLLREYPVDIVVLGVGENGHIAFNDPPVADFDDPALIKPVKLDDKCRMQQVHDGCFATFDDVPEYALTLTVPALMAGKKLFCAVPYATKAAAITEMLTTDNVDEHCPATALRLHEGATLYCDKESAVNVL